MSVHTQHYELMLPHPRTTVFEFFADAHNLERITPPSLRFRIATPGPIRMSEGTQIDYVLRIRGVPARWRTRIANWNPPFQFADTQLLGPYRLWHHTHTFEDCAGGTRMIDDIQYELPFGPLGDMVHALLVRREIETIFGYRNQKIPGLLAESFGRHEFGRDLTLEPEVR